MPLRKSVEAMELSGAYRKDPSRRRIRPPKSNHPLGDPPKYFSRDEKTIWRELVEAMPPGVLAGTDRIIVEAYCQLAAKLRRREMSGGDWSVMLTMIGRMGLSPVDRTKLTGTTQPKEPENRFAKFSEAA